MLEPIMIFDGDCNFCRACVQWIVKHDPEGSVHYAPLQSEPGRELLRRQGVDPEDVDSAAFIDGGQLYFASDAVLEVLRYTDSRWRHARRLRSLPRPLRDFGYRLVSSNRPLISRMLGTIHRRYEPSGPERRRFLAQ